MSEEQREMIEYSIQDIVKILIEEKGLAMEEAMQLFYSSHVCALLNDVETGLYLEGEAYIFEMLNKELQANGETINT